VTGPRLPAWLQDVAFPLADITAAKVRAIRDGAFLGSGRSHRTGQVTAGRRGEIQA